MAAADTEEPVATKNSKTAANNRGQSPTPSASAAPNRQQAETFENAMQLFHQRDFRRAIPLFEQAAEGPDMGMVYSARTHLRMCESRLANSDPSARDSEQNYHYGMAQVNLRNHAGAVVALEMSVKQRETDYAHYALAVALGNAGKVDQAAQHLRRAIQLQPRNRTAALTDPDFSELAKHQPIRDLLTGS